MLKPAEKEGKKGITLDLQVTPAARKNEFAGLHGDRLKVKVAAKAQEGAANAALIKFVSESFSVPLACVQILSGHKGRMKTLFIASSKKSQSEQIAEQTQFLKLAQKLSSAGPDS